LEVCIFGPKKRNKRREEEKLQEKRVEWARFLPHVHKAQLRQLFLSLNSLEMKIRKYFGGEYGYKIEN